MSTLIPKRTNSNKFFDLFYDKDFENFKIKEIYINKLSNSIKIFHGEECLSLYFNFSYCNFDSVIETSGLDEVKTKCLYIKDFLDSIDIKYLVTPKKNKSEYEITIFGKFKDIVFLTYYPSVKEYFACKSYDGDFSVIDNKNLDWLSKEEFISKLETIVTFG